jgi:hypothetical protein
MHIISVISFGNSKKQVYFLLKAMISQINIGITNRVWGGILF